MGLDMYLYSTVKVGSIKEAELLTARIYNCKDVKSEVFQIMKEKNLAEVVPIVYNNSNSKVNIVIQEIYWRKFNSLHGWFVREIQGGEDICKSYIVSIDKLKELNHVLQNSTNDEIVKVLPPVGGFFFGSTEIDEEYWDSITTLKEELDFLLINLSSERSLIYWSDW